MRSVAPLMLFLFACGPVATPDYQGEPIGTLKGTITSELLRAPPAELVLLWINWRSAPGTVLGTRSSVDGTFPAGFDVRLYVPPPDEGLNVLPVKSSEITEPRLGFAWITVLREGAAPPNGDTITHADVKGLSPGDVLGWAEDFIFAYLDAPVPAGSFAEEILGAQLPAGYHLMRASGRGGTDLEEIRRCKEAGGASQVCSPSIQGLSPADEGEKVRVRLTSELGLLRVPVFSLPPTVEDAYGI
jgi:hypothetical protein